MGETQAWVVLLRSFLLISAAASISAVVYERADQQFFVTSKHQSHRRRHARHWPDQRQDNSLPFALIEEVETSLAEKTRSLLGTLRLGVDKASGAISIAKPKGMEDVKVFNTFDSDHSGLIEKGEFKAALKALGYGLDEEGLLKSFLDCDDDSSNAIDMDELKHRIVHPPTPTDDDKTDHHQRPGNDMNKCAVAVMQIKSNFVADHHDIGEVAAHLEGWCVSLSGKSPTKTPEEHHAALAWKQGCAGGRQLLEDALANGKSFSAALFCKGMSVVLKDDVADAEHHHKIYVFPHNGTDDDGGVMAPYAAPVATASCDLGDLKEPRPCCKAHGLKGCHDKPIEACVCAVDPACCEEKWDIRCTEFVEKIRLKEGYKVLRCGRCPAPRGGDGDEQKSIADCLAGAGACG